MKNLICIVLLFASATLTASINGSIGTKGIPKISGTIGVQESYFLYEAPLANYYAISFGFITNRYEMNGFVMGAEMQWIDSDIVRSTFGVDLSFLPQRSFDSYFVGMSGNLLVAVGDDKSGFSTRLKGTILQSTVKLRITTIEETFSAYFTPVENFIVSIGPGLGKDFGYDDNFYITFFASLEVKIWK